MIQYIRLTPQKGMEFNDVRTGYSFATKDNTISRTIYTVARDVKRNCMGVE
jgi:hypothetical protein